jgi:hypothetical protein
MVEEKLAKLRIVAGDVLLVGEEGGVAGYDSGESRAEAQEAEKFFLVGGDVFVAGDGDGFRCDLGGVYGTRRGLRVSVNGSKGDAKDGKKDRGENYPA